ncbi:MAG: Amuc_1100 family pilus-like protein [Methylacidiphilales bacterium]|nr:Amuc_1100 family pilus-like protein [Candidatus Methylacidiphilales bacterium]
MKKLSRFDLGIIIAFAVVTLLGGGAWWYLSGQLQAAVQDVTQAKADFDKYSTKNDVVVSPANETTLHLNIDVLKAQLRPLIQSKLQPKENKLRSIEKEDPVAWKHDLDDEVQRLNAAATQQHVAVPHNFYFGFSRYISQNPGDEQTAVLSKQLVGIEQLATILINAPVTSIKAIRRTYEEEPRAAANAPLERTTDADRLPGNSQNAAGDVYTAYPFEVDFEATPESLRPIINSLIQSPYLFVVRTLTIHNSKSTSPHFDALDKMAGPPPAPVVETSPGDVAAAASTTTVGPQYLFGDATIKVTARIDMIEWKAEVPEGGK